VDDIVRVYTERYFPACQANKVRILWEPYPGGANIAISPAGFEALFKGFGDSPYVGLQYDGCLTVLGNKGLNQFLDRKFPPQRDVGKVWEQATHRS